MTNEFPRLELGDVLLSRGVSFFSRAIRFFGTKARVNHAAIYVGDIAGEPHVIEALGRLKLSPLSNYNSTPVIIWRDMSMSMSQQYEIVRHCMTQNSGSYGWTKIPLFMLDSIFRTYWFTHRLGISNFKVCSQFYAWAKEKVLGAGKNGFAPSWKSVTPDMIDDVCVKNPDTWYKVYDTLPVE